MHPKPAVFALPGLMWWFIPLVMRQASSSVKFQRIPDNHDEAWAKDTKTHSCRINCSTSKKMTSFLSVFSISAGDIRRRRRWKSNVREVSAFFYTVIRGRPLQRLWPLRPMLMCQWASRIAPGFKTINAGENIYATGKVREYRDFNAAACRVV